MGWKTFKEKFKIDHDVQITNKGLCIGSSYVHDLVVICSRTGEIIKDGITDGFLVDRYPEIKNATNEERLAIIKEKDVFSKTLTVYTFENDCVVAKEAEETGWPNITHDGCMMYENTYFNTEKEAIAYGIKEKNSEIKWLNRVISDNEKAIKESKDQLAESLKTLDHLTNLNK